MLVENIILWVHFSANTFSDIRKKCLNKVSCNVILLCFDSEYPRELYERFWEDVFEFLRSFWENCEKRREKNRQLHAESVVWMGTTICHCFQV